MAIKSPQQCPRCGGKAVKMDRVHEPVTSAFGIIPEAQRVDRATCEKGHRWFARDEPEAGDIVIRSKAGVSICTFGVAPDDGVMPPDWLTGTTAEAEAWANKMKQETGGRILNIHHE